MRWPFGPPHLTLKPSKKNNKKTKTKRAKWGGPLGHLTWPLNPQKNKTKKQKKTKQKTTKKSKKRKTKKEKVKNTKTPKKSFSVLSQNFLFLTGYPKIACFDTLAQKTRTQKHYKNRGFSLFFWKKVMRHETAIFGQKNPNSEIPVIIYFLAFFLFQKQKTQKSAETPIFIVFGQT